MSTENDNSFNFAFPVDIYKGKEDGEWRIKGIASTEHLDLQGEIVRQNGLDITPLKNGEGLFNWDHGTGPKNTLGCIDVADKTSKGLYVEGYLFKDSEEAKALHNIMRSFKPKDKRRLKMSIEGKILKRGNFNEKEVSVARIDKVALTFNPVNTNTYAELVKSLASGADNLTANPDALLPEVEIPKSQENTQINPILTTEDEIKNVFKSSLEEMVAQKRITINDPTLPQEDTVLVENNTETAHVEVKAQEQEITKSETEPLAKQIADKVVNFIKSKRPILAIAQEIINNNLDNTELLLDLKKAVDNFDEIKTLELLPKTIMFLNDFSSPSIQKAIVFFRALKKALTTGDYNVAPKDLSDGGSLQKESLKTKHKKKKKEEKDDKQCRKPGK